MNIRNMKKEELELLSYKDITNLILEECGPKNTPDLFKEIVKLLELDSKVYESKIGDYYMMLTTDKRFISLSDGNWDLRDRHTSDKILKMEDEEDDIESEESNIKNKEELEEQIDDFDISNDDYDDEDDDDFKDLVVLDEEELDLEQ